MTLTEHLHLVTSGIIRAAMGRPLVNTLPSRWESLAVLSWITAEWIVVCGVLPASKKQSVFSPHPRPVKKSAHAMVRCLCYKYSWVGFGFWVYFHLWFSVLSVFRNPFLSTRPPTCPRQGKVSLLAEPVGSLLLMCSPVVVSPLCIVFVTLLLCSLQHC